jgi:hypothetical protein
MGTETNSSWFLKEEWLTSNKQELLDNINKTEEKLTEEIKQKEKEREVIRLMRDMIHTIKGG